tara:strand:- start:505 stop:888 length:384 start_codon:yes stop_codon:yes gene_type:complete
MSPFDYLNSINMTKKNLMVDEQSEKDYVPFIVNRGLGYFQDTVLLANEMNVNCHIDSKLQYDFLKSTVSKRKRFSKWLKAEDDEKVDIIRKYFGYNHTVAKSVSHLFSMEQLNTIKKRLDKGGHSKR